MYHLFSLIEMRLWCFKQKQTIQWMFLISRCFIAVVPSSHWFVRTPSQTLITASRVDGGIVPNQVPVSWWNNWFGFNIHYFKWPSDQLLISELVLISPHSDRLKHQLNPVEFCFHLLLFWRTTLWEQEVVLVEELIDRVDWECLTELMPYQWSSVDTTETSAVERADWLCNMMPAVTRQAPPSAYQCAAFREPKAKTTQNSFF